MFLQGNIYVLMESSIPFDTIDLGWFIVYNRQIIIPTYMYNVTLYIAFVLTNNDDLDEMPHYAAFHLGLRCLQKYSFRNPQYQMVKN